MNVLTKAAVQGAACGLMIGAVLLVGGRVWRPATVAAQAPVVSDVVRARSFELVDAAGKVRASLSVLSDGSSALGLIDAAGKTRVGLTVLSDGSPGLVLSDAAGKVRILLSMHSDGRPSLALMDAAEKPRAGLGISDGGGPSVILTDAAGKIRAVLGTISLGVVRTGEGMTRSESSLVLFDKDGTVIWKAP